MKVLLVSDTHGELAGLNELARSVEADAIVHAGDFGFYDEESVTRLSDREIRLRITHSRLSQKEIQRLLSCPPVDWRAFVRDQLPLSDLPKFLSGEMQFDVPVYAVWGNHEDHEVVQSFVEGRYSLERLHLIHPQASWHIGNLHVFGVGGNFLVDRRLFADPIAGSGGKVWSVLTDYESLLRTVERNAVRGERRLLVTHVSPGKEPWVNLMGILTGAQLTVSGHMDPPQPLMWHDFAIRSPEEAVVRIERRIREVGNVSKELPSSVRLRSEDLLNRCSSFPRDVKSHGRREVGPSWYYNLMHLNLPDVPRGYAVLDVGDGVFAVHTQSRK